MHGKEHVMRPLIKLYLDLEVESEIAINTDEFGTFTGEVERLADPITTLRNKINYTIRYFYFRRYIVASERCWLTTDHCSVAPDHCFVTLAKYQVTMC